MNSRALVLGGGGPVGIAWEAGLLAGLADEGVDVRGADLVLGTSAGSVVGSAVAAGVELESVAELQRKPGPSGTPPDVSKVVAFFARFPATGEPSIELRQEIGRYALAAKTQDEEQFVARMAASLPPGDWPDRFACTAVDAETGEFRVWRKSDGVELRRAVASSCAVPGIFPAVTIQGRKWMDGGMRGSLNVDQAAGHERVLAVAVIPAVAARQRLLVRFEAEAATVRAAGGEMMLLAPDDAASAAFGPNLMDASRRAAVMEAGREQGRKEAARLKPFW